MLSRIKKYFFGGVFFILYALFVFQLVKTIWELFGGDNSAGFNLMLLPFLWLALMAARFLYKKCSGGMPGSGGGFHGGHHRH